MAPTGPTQNPDAGRKGAEAAARKAHQEERQRKLDAHREAVKARSLAKAEHRGASYEAQEGLNENPKKTVYQQSHPIGKYAMKGNVDLKNKNDITLKGTVDASWFSMDKKRSTKWYTQLAEDAKLIQSLRPHINANLKGAAGQKINQMIDLLVSMKDADDHYDESVANAKGKVKITNATKLTHIKVVSAFRSIGASKAEIFGSQGVLNYILAFRRAASIVSKKGTTVLRRLKLEDFKKNKNDKFSKFKDIKLSLYPRKKGEKYRETVIKGRDIKAPETEKTEKGKAVEKGPDLSTRLGQVAALKTKLEAEAKKAGMTVEFNIDKTGLYVRQEGKHLSVVNIKSIVKGKGETAFTVNKERYETMNEALKAAKDLISKRIVKNQESQSAKAIDKKKGWVKRMNDYLNRPEIKASLAQHGFKLIEVTGGKQNYAIDSETVEVPANFKYNYNGAEYLIRINGETAKVEILSLIVATVDSPNKATKGQSGVMKLREFSVTTFAKMVDEFRSAAALRKKKEEKMVDKLTN